MMVLIVDPLKKDPRFADIKNDSAEYQKIIGCEHLSMSIKYIEGHPFEFIYDDFFIINNRDISALNSEKEPVFCGTLIVANYNPDEENSADDLTKEEALILQRNFATLGLKHKETGEEKELLVLINVDNGGLAWDYSQLNPTIIHGIDDIN